MSTTVSRSVPRTVRARGEVREELDAAERARVHYKRAVERRGQEDVDAPVARLDV